MVYNVWVIGTSFDMSLVTGIKLFNSDSRLLIGWTENHYEIWEPISGTKLSLYFLFYMTKMSEKDN